MYITGTQTRLRWGDGPITGMERGWPRTLRGGGLRTMEGAAQLAPLIRLGMGGGSRDWEAAYNGGWKGHGQDFHSIKEKI